MNTRGLNKQFTPVSSNEVMVMGQSIVGPLRMNIYDMINSKLDKDFGHPINIDVIFIHGPMQSGKSHIILLLIWDLIEEFTSSPLSQ